MKTEEEVKTPVTTGRGRKRKTEGEAATPTDKKAKKEAEVREVIDRYSLRFTLTLKTQRKNVYPCTQIVKLHLFRMQRRRPVTARRRPSPPGSSQPWPRLWLLACREDSRGNLVTYLFIDFCTNAYVI